jgi:serine/threonine-protein kinase
MLDRRYQVGARIARGGMATVYEAVDTRLDRSVALKIMHSALAEDQDFVTRFIREAKSAARLSHPNVVAVFDQGTDGGYVFLVMEHVAGGNLRDLLRGHGRLSPRQAFDVLEPVLAALGAAHQAGLVHRDVKPENVLLADDGRVKVADFGLARAVSTTTSHASTAGMLIGTVAYLSPEQVSRGVADPRSDVYAAGILLFEMLTGSQPHDGDSPISVAYKHVHDDVPAPSSRVPGLAAEIDELVALATDRDPDQRPEDANRFLAEALRIRRSLPDEALDASTPTLPGAGGGDPTLVVPMPVVPSVAVAADRANGQADVHDGETGVYPRPGSIHDGETGVYSRAELSGAHIAPDIPGGSNGSDGSDGSDSSGGTRRRRRWPAVLLGTVLVVAGVVGFGAWWATAGPGAYTHVPPVIGSSQDAAVEALGAAGLDVEVAQTFNEVVAAGEVISTDPRPNARIANGGDVTVEVSRGPERFEVPALAGSTVSAAAAALAEVELRLAEGEPAFSDTVPAGEIISQDPAAGEALRRDDAVEVVVSRGVEPIEVPAVEGLPLQEAQAALEERRFVVDVTGEDTSRQVPAGAVISQNPTGGTLPKGSTVQLVVSSGPPLVAVPDVRDRKVEDARAVLEESGFAVEVRGTQILDRVFAQSPGAGERVPVGSTITLSSI